MMRCSSEASPMEPMVMTTISAERIKSVRTAPLILSFSLCLPSAAALAWSACGCSGAACLVCSSLWAIFSTPSKHRYAPPSISSGLISQGSKALISNASGTSMSLLIMEPLATAQTTGNSRSACTPATCCALSAKSSPSTPAVFLAATLLITETSSSKDAISSSSINRLVAMGLFQ